MQIPRQQFALRISSSECQRKSFTGFICLLSGKVSRRGQAAISRDLGWKGRHLGGSLVTSAGAVTWGDDGAPKEGLQCQKWSEDAPSIWKQWEDDLRAVLQTCWAAVGDQEVSGNTGRLWLEKQQDKQQERASIHGALEEEGPSISSQLVTYSLFFLHFKISWIFFATGFQVKRKNKQSFQMKQKLMLSQQFQPSLAKFCSGTNGSLPSGVCFQLSKLKSCPHDPFSVTANFTGHF